NIGTRLAQLKEALDNSDPRDVVRLYGILHPKFKKAKKKGNVSQEFERLIAEGAFIHFVEHAGNYYGTLRADADAVLATRYAIGAFVEQGVMNLRRSGYTVRVVKIVPVGGFTPNVPSRKAEDDARDKIDVSPELIIENDFASGGFERARTKLFAWVETLP
ncbi:MAG: hypothetical protein Q7R41_14315, partial [Phycisphaerales bacterium]|nr:hypothetical protein [Phycisphaerales bacterium]